MRTQASMHMGLVAGKPDFVACDNKETDQPKHKLKSYQGLCYPFPAKYYVDLLQAIFQYIP